MPSRWGCQSQRRSPAQRGSAPLQNWQQGGVVPSEAPLVLAARQATRARLGRPPGMPQQPAASPGCVRPTSWLAWGGAVRMSVGPRHAGGNPLDPTMWEARMLRPHLLQRHGEERGWREDGRDAHGASETKAHGSSPHAVADPVCWLPVDAVSRGGSWMRRPRNRQEVRMSGFRILYGMILAPWARLAAEPGGPRLEALAPFGQVVAMVLRLLRPLLAILVTVALVGAPTVQATSAVPCDTMHMTNADHQASSGGAHAPASCKMVPGCVDALGCVSLASLPVPAISAEPLVWTAIAYWIRTDVCEGRSVEPILDPPIPFA